MKKSKSQRPNPKISKGRTRRLNAGGKGGKLSTGGLRDEEVTVEWFREEMRRFVREREWGKFHTPRNLAASVAVEAGELLELFQWLTPEEAERRCREDESFRKAVGEEFTDVFMYLISLANAVGFEVAETVAAKMAKNREKYPAERYRGWYERPVGGGG